MRKIFTIITHRQIFLSMLLVIVSFFLFVAEVKSAGVGCNIDASGSPLEPVTPGQNIIVTYSWSGAQKCNQPTFWQNHYGFVNLVDSNGTVKKSYFLDSDSGSSMFAYTVQSSDPDGTWTANLFVNSNSFCLTTNCSDNIEVISSPPPTLTVTLSANPSSGNAPLSSQLTATVAGTDPGPFSYKFDCTNDGSWEYQGGNNKYTCIYNNPGTYTAKVKASGVAASDTDTVSISVSSGGSVCGNGIIDPGESCDDGDHKNNDSCPDGPGGTCQPAVCGDGFIWNTDGGSEQCDGTNLGGKDCTDFGFASPGGLSCSASCTFDTSGCGGAGGCSDHDGWDPDTPGICTDSAGNPFPDTCSGGVGGTTVVESGCVGGGACGFQNKTCAGGKTCQIDPVTGAAYCSGGPGPGPGPGGPFTFVLPNPINANSIQEMIDSLINLAFVIGIALAPVLVIVGGLYFILSAGDPAKIETAKKIIFYTLIGLFVVILARAIIGIIRTILSG